MWGQLEAQKGYEPIYEVMARHLGPEAMDLERSYKAEVPIEGHLITARK